MNMAKRLGFKTEKEKEKEERRAAGELQRRIEASEQTITMLGRKHKYIPLEGISPGDYRFTGSGLVSVNDKLILRVDWEGE